MSVIELPHTPGCLVCGPSNPAGLKLSLFVEPATGIVTTRFTPGIAHTGFEKMSHGGALAAVVDEAMVWAATWSIRRFCVCGEMSIRFRKVAAIGRALKVQAAVESARPKLILTAAKIVDGDETIANATGKYVPMQPEKSDEFMKTLLDSSATREAAAMLKAGDVGALGAQD